MSAALYCHVGRSASGCRGVEAATRLENATSRFPIKKTRKEGATEEGQHRKPKQIKTSALACPMSRGSNTTPSSTGCAKRPRSERATDGNFRRLKCKRMDSKSYIALFEPASTTGLVVKNAKKSPMPTETKKIKERPFQKLQRLPKGCHPDFDNDHLCSVNRLREFWHKSQGAVLLDDKEIVMKTVLFIMSLLPDICKPFLVVTTASLSLWEAEFKRLAPIINVVVYDGDKEARKSIRDLKFNTSGSSMMSQVFLAHPDAILEDIETVQCSSWEAVMVEYCQNSVLRLLKQLPTNSRIVLLSSPPEDNLLEYKNLVAFLSSEEEDNGCHVDDTLANLKAKFTRHIAYDRKTVSSNLLEYWVPAYLSKVQLQLYSSILLTKSSILQSQVATDSVGALGDIIRCLWKCCDHPCLVDEFPHNSLVNIDDETEFTDSRMHASGKLLLLEKMLREFRNKKSRVIVLFQSDGPGENKMGKILEEFVRHRFGPESYEHVQNRSTYSKKQAAMTMFNDKTKGRFVFLIENHACHSSIRLSSIDAVIIYDSNWNPLNDLKALGKIQIESRVEYLSIFRLYIPFTVEEKCLMLAKQGVIIDCNIQDIVPSLSHCLLSWGVSFLFGRLDELHQDNPSCKSSERGTLCMDKVILEFLTVLSTNSNGATISKAYMSGEFYSKNITLIGEKEGASSLDVDPPGFWLYLLDGKSPCHLSEPPQVKHRNLQYMEKLTDGPDEETNKGRRQHGKTGEIASSSSKSSSGVSNNDVSPEITPSGVDLQSDTRQKLGMGNLLSTPKSLHVQLKYQLSKLIKVLELPDNVRLLAEQLLEYLLKNHLVVLEPRGILHAFNIALCWHAAFLLKYNLDRSDSLAVAASSLNYEHNEELAGLFYKKLATLNEKVRHKPDENSNDVENDMFSSEGSSSTNLRNCHMFSKQAMDLHGNLTNNSPQESSSGQVVSAPEGNRECHFSSGDQLLDDKLVMEIMLVQNAVPSEAISTRTVGNEPAEALVSSGGESASESVYLPGKNIKYSSGSKKTTDMSKEGETEYPTCATHDTSREAETDNGQKSVPAQQSKSSHAQESLAAFQHPPEEVESAGILGNLLPDELRQSTSVQDQTAEAEQAGMLGITEAQDLQHEIQPSTTIQDVPPERADLSGVLLTQSPTVLHGVEPLGHLHAEPSSTSGIAVAPNLIPEIRSASSMQDGPVGGERSGTSGTIAAQVLLPETQPSVSVQHIPPEGTHSDDMIQISLPGQQSTGLDSQQSVAASSHLVEQEEPAGIPGVVVADAFQPSTLMLNQTMQAEQADSMDAVATQDLHTEPLPSSTTHDVPCEETDQSSMPVPQGTNSQQSLEVSRDTHAEREPENALRMFAAHDLRSGMHPSSSVQYHPMEAEGAGQSNTISAMDLQPGKQPSIVIHHITPEITHSDERIQMSQPNETPSQTSLQPNEAPSQLLTELFSMGPAAFNHLIYSPEPLRNELEKLKYYNNLLAKNHQQKKLLLQAEYDKELEKLNRKYKSLHHKEDSTYHQMAAQLDDICYKVSMHQLVAENFREQLTKSYTSQERSTSPTIGQIPQTSQQAPARTSWAQTTASPVASSSATRLPVLTSFHSTGSLRSEVQPLPGNLHRATSSDMNSIPQRNGTYGAARAQLRGPSHLHHLQMPQPYATVHRDHQQIPVIGPGFTSLRHPAPGILTSPLAGHPMTSISSSSLHQPMASASNSHPVLPAPSLQLGSLAELVGANPVVMAAQQASTLNLDAAAGIWHRGAHMAGVANPAPESASETLPFPQRLHAVRAGAALPSVASSSARPSASNSQPNLATSLATNTFFMAGQQGPSPNLAFHNNSVPLNAAAGIRRTRTHIAVANQPVPDSALMNVCPACRTGVTNEPTSAGTQRGGSGEVVCLSDDE